MKKVSDVYEDMPSEIDFSDGVRGRYAGAVEPLNNLVLIDPDLFEVFPSAEAVNEALRLLKMAGAKATSGRKHSQAKAS